MHEDFTFLEYSSYCKKRNVVHLVLGPMFSVNVCFSLFFIVLPWFTETRPLMCNDILHYTAWHVFQGSM